MNLVVVLSADSKFRGHNVCFRPRGRSRGDADIDTANLQSAVLLDVEGTLTPSLSSIDGKLTEKQCQTYLSHDLRRDPRCPQVLLGISHP